MKKTKIAITGNIGVGKSAVAEYLRKKGHTVLDADAIAKDLYLKPNIRKTVIETFGKETYKDDKPDYQYIGKLVFGDDEKLHLLNSIIHPFMIRAIQREMDSVLQNQNVVFTEAALIYEASMEEMFDYVVLVTAPDELKIKRTMQRNGITEEEVKNRLEKQISEDIKKTHADFVIGNNSDMESLYKKCDFIFKLALQIS